MGVRRPRHETLSVTLRQFMHSTGTRQTAKKAMELLLQGGSVVRALEDAETIRTVLHHEACTEQKIQGQIAQLLPSQSAGATDLQS